MIHLFKVNMAPEAAQAVAEVLQSGMVGEGPKTEQFRGAIRELFNHQGVVLTNSCTSALQLAVRLAGLEPGDLVISTPFTFPATNCVLGQQRIIWGPLDPRTLALDLEQTLDIVDYMGAKAVMLTLVGGVVPHGLGWFWNELQPRNVSLILDAAHALLTTYQSQHISHYGDLCTFSFQAIKHLCTADGGALVCNNGTIERAERLKWFGMSRNVPPGTTRLEHQMNYSIPEYGYKMNMNDVAAAMGLANLQVAKEAVAQSKSNAAFYQEAFRDMKNIELLQPPVDSESSWWIYGFESNRRDAIIQALKEKEIIASPMWKLNSEHLCFSKNPDIPSNKELASKLVFIPNGFWVTEEDRNQIVQIVQEVAHAKIHIWGYPRSGNNWLQNRLTLFHHKCLKRQTTLTEMVDLVGITHFGYGISSDTASLDPYLRIGPYDRIICLLRDGKAVVNSYFLYMHKVNVPKEPRLHGVLPNEIGPFARSSWGVERLCRFMNEIEDLKPSVPPIRFLYFIDAYEKEFIKNLPWILWLPYQMSKEEIDYIHRNSNLALLKQGKIDDDVKGDLRNALLRKGKDGTHRFRDGTKSNWKKTMDQETADYIDQYLADNCRLVEYRMRYVRSE